MKRPAAVVFDLDGTLVDSRRDIATAVDRLRVELGLGPLGEERVGRMVGEGARVLVERALAVELVPAVELPTIDVALSRFLELYSAVCTRTTRAYPGIDDLLSTLGAAGLPLALLTNKPVAMTGAILDSLGWSARFAVVLGGDSLPSRKPDPAGMEEVARRLGVAVADSLLVGDSATDARTAVAAGCRLVLVRWGYGRPEELARFAPERAIERPTELLALLGAA